MVIMELEWILIFRNNLNFHMWSVHCFLLRELCSPKGDRTEVLTG